MKFAPFLIGILTVVLIVTSMTNAFGFDWRFFWKTKPDQPKIAAGLKEALQIGAENTVNRTGRIDGFYKNEAIRIPLPDQMQKAEKLLRQMGLGAEIDQFELSLNRAAEAAAPAAKELFWNAITEMTFEDAVKILNGCDTAATDYFRSKTEAHLRTAFLPIISRATDEVDATRIYKQLTLEVQKIKFLKLEPVDIDQYVATKAINGLFHVLGEEERKIREDPAARVTDLLKEVFGD
ncbi:MAG: DUF4197 domain-containing protein [Firmicutes bacterium]|nr:DUF4197 domain-containing protein [Bacillota bacterium]